MKTKYCKRWFAFILLAAMLVACSDSQAVTTSTATNAATTTPTTTPLPPTATIAPTATAIPLAWTQVNDGQEFARDKIIAFEIDPKDPDVLFVSMENAGYYQSIDGGISWQSVQIENLPADISSKLIAHKDYDRLNEENITNIGLDGKERSYTAVITANWRVSKDGGKTWSEFGIIGRPRSTAITFDVTGSVFVYCDTHLCKYSADGKEKYTLGIPDVGLFTIIKISPYDSNTIYVAGKGLAVSKNGGLAWTKLNNGLGSEKLQLDTSSGDTPVVYLQSGECEEAHGPEHQAFHDDAGQPLYLSSNGGNTWDLSLQGGCYLVKDASELIIYRVGQQSIWSTGHHHLGWVWLSTDQGNTWQTRYLMDVMIPFTVAAHPFQNGILYAYSPQTFSSPGGYGGEKTFISVDYGNNWKTADSTGRDLKPCYGSTLQFIDEYRPMAIDPRDGNHVFVIDNGTLLESHDSCDTTEAFTTPPNSNMNSIAFDPNNPDTLYAGTDDGAYISFDSGNSWNQINDGLTVPLVVYSIAVDKDGNVYASTPNGIFQLTSK